MGSERGGAAIIVVAGTLSLCLSALAVADFGAVVVSRARAQAAAEAAALAAAVRQAPVLGQDGEPEEAAREAAEANGALLVRCECRRGEEAAVVEVALAVRTVLVRAWDGRRVRATARADLDPHVLSYRT